MKLYYYFILIILITSLWGGNSQAEVIFQDNFDSQIDWEPTSSSECGSDPCSTMPVNWYYYRSMGEFNSPDGNNTIRITNDNYQGSSGKALTIWTESGDPQSWSADGLIATVFQQDQKEIFVRFYMKMQTPWTWDAQSDGMLKIMQIFHWDRAGNIFQGFSTGTEGPIYIFDLKHSLNWGWRHMHSFRCDPQESNYYCQDSGNYDFNELWGNNFASPGDLGDGQWHSLEFRLKMNTFNNQIWLKDGEFDFWYDGVLKSSKRDIQWKSSGEDAGFGFNTLLLGGNQLNHYAPPELKAEQWYAIDDVIVSTTRIGSLQTKTIQIINITY